MNYKIMANKLGITYCETDKFYKKLFYPLFIDTAKGGTQQIFPLLHGEKLIDALVKQRMRRKKFLKSKKHGKNLDIDVTGSFDMLASTTFSVDGTGASNVTATSGNLTGCL